MRKITLLMAALFVGALSFGQIVDRPVGDSGTGLISTVGDDFGVYSADFFSLDEETDLGEFSFHGFGGDQFDPTIGAYVTGFDLYILEDAGGVPDGTPVDPSSMLVNLGNISDFELDESQNSTFTVNVTQANGGETVTLPAGDYWVIAAPVVSGSAAGDGRWNWFEGSVAADYDGEDAMLLDPDNAFGEGTQWAPISDLIGEPFTAFAWSLIDEAMDVDKHDLAAFTHFTQNGQLFLESASQIQDVAIYNLLGQEVVNTTINATSGSIDLGSLNSGVYLTKVSVDGQVKTFKFSVR